MPAKADRAVKQIAASYRKRGYSAKNAESAAWATVNKMGMLDTKKKGKGKKGASGKSSKGK